jgi:imidazolonepropionase-like amidohydrolase
VIVGSDSNPPTWTALVGGTVIDGRGGPPIVDGIVLVRGERIEQVGRRDDVALPEEVAVIDTAGRFVLPGLIDIHVHYFDWMGELFLAHGVTAVKDVGNDVDWIATVSGEIARGAARGPRIFYTGNGLDVPPPRRDHFIGLEGPEMARRVVALLAERGAIAIKVRERLPVELLRPVVEEAHRRGLKVTGHLRATDARQAAVAGIDGLEHASGIVQATIDPQNTIDLDLLEARDIYAKYVAERKSYAWIDESRAGELVTELADRQVALIPTMAGWWRMASHRRDAFAAEDSTYADDPSLAYVPDEARSIWSTSKLYQVDDPGDVAQLNAGFAKVRALLRRHHEAGGVLLAGSDTYLSVPGLSLQRELLFLVDCGFAPAQAISIATLHNARFIGQDGDIGSLEAGKLADAVVLDEDPLARIDNIATVSTVLCGGRVVDTTYHADYAVPTPRPVLRRPLGIERRLAAGGRP